MDFDDVKHTLGKILKVIYQDRTKLTDSTSDGGASAGRITAWRLEQAVCNHLFDDHPEQFGITEQESHVLRDYIQSKADTGREYIELLHKEFPEFMDKENERYVDDVNTERKMQGLMPLHL